MKKAFKDLIKWVKGEDDDFCYYDYETSGFWHLFMLTLAIFFSIGLVSLSISYFICWVIF